MLALLQGAQAAGEVAEAAGHESAVISLVGAYVGLMVIAAALSALAKRFKIPFTVALVVAGALPLRWRTVSRSSRRSVCSRSRLMRSSSSSSPL